jgi:hypothetical protein
MSVRVKSEHFSITVINSQFRMDFNHHQLAWCSLLLAHSWCAVFPFALLWKLYYGSLSLGVLLARSHPHLMFEAINIHLKCVFIL